jgi:hypothetical protein
MLLVPGKEVAEGGVQTAWLDLMSSYGGGLTKTWLHVPVDTQDPSAEVEEPEERTSAGEWHTLRLDVVGRSVDLWYDGDLVGTRDFPSKDVLRGGFGLLMGPGKARFQNVRFLARDPADPASAIERAITHEALAARDGGTGAVQGSYQGVIPPFPTIKRWIQGPREDWAEARGGPQLLVLWDIDQNMLVRIDQWLTYLEEGFRDVGLEVVSVVSTHDEDRLEAYLVDHPMPGSVGVDYLPPNSVGIGESFESFFIRRFNLPRVLLLDLDGTVLWEGDPGFEINEEPIEPFESFLDDPLEELVTRRKLRELAVWRTKWERYGAPALAQGDFEEALPMLMEAGDYDPVSEPRAARASAALRSVQAALDDLEGSAASFEARGVETGMDVLIGWGAILAGDEAEVFEKEHRARKEARDVLQSKNHRDWIKVLKACAAFPNRRGTDAEKALAMFAELDKRGGLLVELLRAELDEAHAVEDWEAFASAVESVPTLGARFLAESYFGWEGGQ